MNLSPLKRLLLCACILSASVLMIAPRTAYASPGIWEWFKWGMRIGGNVNELKNMDIDWWVSHAGMAGADFALRTFAGCDYDTLLWCAAQEPPFPAATGVNENEPNCDPCNPEGGSAEAFMPGGAFGYASLAIEEISTISPPFSLTLYANDIKGNTLVGGQTYAQGGEIYGDYWRHIFDESTLEFWKQARNLAYLLFVVILIAIGFMVMLRYQVSPRTTVTVTAALPKIAIGLVLITFSYPIVSLAIDLIRVLTLTAQNLVGSVWSKIPGTDNYFSGGVISYILIQITVFKNLINLFAGRVNLFSVFLTLFTMLVLLLTEALALWEFLKRFVGLIYMGIFGPLIIAWGTLPGQEEAIGGWFKKIIANVLALPAITLYMGVGLLILTVNTNSPHDLPTFWAVQSDIVAQAITYFIGISILWQAHKVPGALDSALSGEKRR